jgi:hypothetical protein
MENDLTIQLFFFTSAIFAAAGTVKKRGWRAWLFGSLAAVFGLGGAAWTLLKEVYPSLSRAIADVALNPQAWFTLFVLVLAVVAFTGRKGRTTGEREDGPDLPEWVPSLPDRLSSTEESLEVFTRSITSQNKSLDSLDKQGKELSLRLEAIESMLRPDGKGNKGGKGLLAPPRSEQDNRFTNIEEKIEGARDYAKGLSDGVAHSVGQLRQMIEGNSRQIQNFYQILILHEQDVVVRELGEKLLKADPATYANDAAWDDDYARWKSALEHIANIAREWVPHWVPNRTRFLDLKASDYETNTAALPSTSKLTSDRSLVRYKTVAQGQHNYESQREAMFQFFLQKATELPG